MAKQRIKAKRRAKEKEIISTLTLKKWLEILKEYNYKCAYCEIEFDENTLPEKDHLIPTSKGEHNIKENIVPACRSCNTKKNNKFILNRFLLEGGIYVLFRNHTKLLKSNFK